MDQKVTAVHVSVAPEMPGARRSERPAICTDDADTMDAYGKWCVRFTLSFAVRSTR
jgi:hypothetical protein